MRKVLLYSVFFSIILFTFTACAYLKKPLKPENLRKIKAEEVKKGDKEEEKRLEIKQKVKYLLERKSYLQALSLIDREVKKGLPETYFEKEYLVAINGLIDSGEGLLLKGDYEQAGRLFGKALQDYPKKKSLRAKVKSTPESIVSNIEICSERLMERGLLEYRDGNLGNAIRIWKKILIFNPDYDEAGKAVETTTIQLKNLKSIETKGK